jgi:hypothetical protein
VPNFTNTNGLDWYSQGTISRTARHGLELCKDWFDKRP